MGQRLFCFIHDFWGWPYKGRSNYGAFYTKECFGPVRAGRVRRKIPEADGWRADWLCVSSRPRSISRAAFYWVWFFFRGEN